MGLPFNLEFEEDRELKAINGYNKEYRKNLIYYFKCYANEIKRTITKSKFVKMLRDKGIGSERLDYEELGIIIRRLFKENLNEFNFNQFINLLVQVSHLIFIKRRPTLTIGETYGILLKRFTLKNNAQKMALLRKKYEPVIDYLLELKADNEPFNLPEGFKFVKKTNVKYNSRLAPHFLDILGEGNFICYQVLEDILFHIFNSSIIEPYVEISTEETVEIEPEKLHNWTPDLTMAYIDLDKKLKFQGMFAADAIEDGLRKIIKKNKIKDYLENENGEGEEEGEGENDGERKHNKLSMSWARKDIKKKMELYKKIKLEKKRKKNPKRIDIFKVSKEEKEKIQEKFEEVKKRREQKEEEKKNKIISEQQKRKEKEEKKISEWIKCRNEKKRKLKEQFKTIVTKRKENHKKEEEKKEKEIKFIKDFKEKSLLNKDKNYYAFEKQLNSTMKELVARDEIKEVLEKYNNHIKLVYDIYSKISYNKISFYSKEVIRIDEFKQFLINFTVLGVVINSEQMIWIFNNISKVLQSQRNNEMYLDFDEFKLSLCYLAIFSKDSHRGKKILPEDIEETKGENIENFMKFLGFKMPFNRLDIEKFINERRSISMKKLLSIQHGLKKEKRNENNKIENNKNAENSKEQNSENNQEIKDSNNSDKNNINNNENSNNEVKEVNNAEKEKTDENNNKDSKDINQQKEKENKTNKVNNNKNTKTSGKDNNSNQAKNSQKNNEKEKEKKKEEEEGDEEYEEEEDD